MAKTKSQPKKGKKRRKKKKSLLGRILTIAFPLVLLAGLGWGTYRYLHPLTLKGDYYVTELKEPFDTYGNVKSMFFHPLDSIILEGSVDTSELGKVEVSYLFEEGRYPFIVEVKDTKGPNLALTDIVVDVNTPVTAEDFITEIGDASDYSFRMDGQTEPGSVGTFPITITARDAYNNVTTKTAQLIRKTDKTAPSLEGFDEKIVMLQGDVYAPRSYLIKDDLDKDPKVYIDSSQLDISTPGTYHVQYTTSDRSGNQRSYHQTVIVQQNPDFGKPICYLTFDDGPSELTPQILEILDQYNVKGTFFVTGLNEKCFNYINTIKQNGHAIGLHSYTDNYPIVYASEEAYFDDLQKISDLVVKQTGNKVDILRFPGGSSNAMASTYSQGLMNTLIKEIALKGYSYFDWNVDSADDSGPIVDVETIVASACRGIGLDNVVIRMHDTTGKENTIQALPQIIQAYQNQGYVFRGLTRTSVPVHHFIS